MLIIVIDEAQRVKNIGLILKIAIDNFSDRDFIVTGSSSLDLSNEIIEPLTGRKYTNYLYPLSISELSETFNPERVKFEINNYLKWGLYPEVANLSLENERKEYLFSLVNDYLYKDVLEYQDVRKPDVLSKLLKLIAYQIGNEVSVHELSRTLGIDQQTVYSYLDLLEKSFVIYRLTSFSRNLRKEINTKEKIYFYDLGIRNALIGDFNDVDIRLDKGFLWENFLILERIKKNHYQDRFRNLYFWRTYQKAEIDLIEEYDGELNGYEIKYSSGKNKKAPTAWKNTYKNATWEIVDIDNYFDFIA